MKRSEKGKKDSKSGIFLKLQGREGPVLYILGTSSSFRSICGKTQMIEKVLPHVLRRAQLLTIQCVWEFYCSWHFSCSKFIKTQQEQKCWYFLILQSSFSSWERQVIFCCSMLCWEAIWEIILKIFVGTKSGT